MKRSEEVMQETLFERDVKILGQRVKNAAFLDDSYS